MFFLFNNLFAQSTINNFGISEFINSYSGYTKFSLIDFDQDGTKDLILYGNNHKNFVLHRGLKDSTFSKPIKKFFFFPIDDFKWLTKTKSGEDYYLFVSRNKRLIGLVSFTRSNSLQLLNSIEFNSYPSSIKIVDLNKNGKNEALVFGNNFDGIQHISNNGYRLENYELNNESVYSDIILKDFNQDDLVDLIVIDVIKNSISFLENADFNGFVPVREIQFEDNLISITSLEINKDNFSDLIVAKENGLEFLFGDSVYSYIDRSIFKTPITGPPIIIADLYKDSFYDLAKINHLDDQLVIYSNIDKEEESINIEFNGISDINVLKKKNSNSLIVLSKTGKILNLSSQKYNAKSFSFVLGGSPDKLEFLSFKDSSYSNIFIGNSKDNSISIIKFDSSDVFSELEKKTLLNSYSDFSISKMGNLIACYTFNNRLIEIVSNIQSEPTLYNSEFVYTSHEIENLIVDKDNSIQVLELSENELFHESIIKKNGRYFPKEIFSIDTQVVKSQILGSGEIYYWVRTANNYEFKKSVLGNPEPILNITSNALNANILILPESNGSSNLITIIADKLSEKVFLVNDNKIQQFNSNKGNIAKNIKNEKYIKYYNFGTQQKMILSYDKPQRKVFQYLIDDKEKTIVLRKSFEDIDLNDYFVQRFNDKMHLIYSDNTNNCLTFKVLD